MSTFQGAKPTLVSQRYNNGTRVRRTKDTDRRDYDLTPLDIEVFRTQTDNIGRSRDGVCGTALSVM